MRVSVRSIVGELSDLYKRPTEPLLVIRSALASLRFDLALPDPREQRVFVRGVRYRLSEGEALLFADLQSASGEATPKKLRAS